MSASPQRVSRYMTRTRAAVAAILVIGAAVAVVQAIRDPHTIATAPGEWRQLSLDDNSVVKVGPRTELRVDFNDTQRTVSLAGGEAAFQVAKDPQRPFVVVAGDTRVQAIGTAFGVTRESDVIVVTVSEGRVAVTRDSADKSLPLIAGEQVRIPSAAPLLPKAKRVNVAQELAWADRRVIFEDAVVADAVREFNRRNRIQIRIDAPQLERMPVRAMFNAADPESFADFLATASGARVVREDKELLVLKAN